MSCASLRLGASWRMQYSSGNSRLITYLFSLYWRISRLTILSRSYLNFSDSCSERTSWTCMRLESTPMSPHSGLWIACTSVTARISTHLLSLNLDFEATTSYEKSHTDLSNCLSISSSLSPGASSKTFETFLRCLMIIWSLSSNIFKDFICRLTSMLFLKAMELISFSDFKIMMELNGISWSRLERILFKLIKILPSPYSSCTFEFFEK